MEINQQKESYLRDARDDAERRATKLLTLLKDKEAAFEELQIEFHNLK